MIWISLGLMLLAAVTFVAWPLYRKQNRLSGSGLAMALTVVGISALVYWQIGTPDAPSARASSAGNPDLPAIEDMVESLSARLEQQPDDLDGWKMLGRTYMQLRRFPEAIDAFERAMAIEGGSNGQTLADLGEVILMNDQEAINGRAGQLFESALALEPANPKALFYAGLAAINRGNNELGAARWEALLATSPPENVQEILRQRIAELRGQAVEPLATAPAVEQAGGIITVNVDIGANAGSVVPANATVFIIARDPDQPSPPIAALRRQASELPATIVIGDADAMVPGRVPSGFEKLEIIARVSMSGQPMAQSGDWQGQTMVSPNVEPVVSVLIDEQVP